MRGLQASDPGAARVGVIECTSSLTPYTHPGFPNIVLWDVPGVGTPRFPMASYESDVELNKYDFLLIMASDRFTQNDQWLARRSKIHGVPFFFIRNKIDLAIANELEDYPQRKEFRILHTIRKDCNVYLDGLTESVYLISARFENRRRWDLPLLLEDMKSTLADLKRAPPPVAHEYVSKSGNCIIL